MAVDMTKHYQQELDRLADGIEACSKQIARDAKKYLTIFGMEQELQIVINVRPDELVSIEVIADGLPEEEFWPHDNKRPSAESTPRSIEVNGTKISQHDD
ncbi:MAG: hypothetical protein LUC87_00625 [Clostridiales bacterium]|nr:hypothetical protein [Clostridiales bacterium]